MRINIGTDSTAPDIDGKPHPYMISDDPNRAGVFATATENRAYFNLCIPLRDEEAEALALPVPPPDSWLAKGEESITLEAELEIELPEFQVLEYALAHYETDEKRWWLDIVDIAPGKYVKLEEAYPIQEVAE